VPQDLSAIRAVALGNTLRSCQLFSGVSLAELEQIASLAIPKQLEKGEYLFREGEPSRGFYVVQAGAVNVHRMSPTGKEQMIWVFRAGQSFAEASLTGSGDYPASARALEPTHVLLIPKAEILALLRRRPEFALRMLGAMSQHLRVLVALLDDLTLKNVETRLANWLLKRCPRPLRAHSVTFQLDRTKRVLAAEIGTVSETLSRTFGDFRRRKLITVSGKTITVRDPIGLEAVLRKNLGET